MSRSKAWFFSGASCRGDGVNRRIGRPGTISLWGKKKKLGPLWKIIQWFVINLSQFFPYDPAIILLGITQVNVKTYVHTKTTQMFITTLFIVDPNLEAIKSPSVSK